jgi:hypothetical protein
MYGSVSLSRMKHVVGAAVCVCALGVGATPALADQSTASVQQAGPCPPENWFLAPPAPGDERFDRNGNGLVCVLPIGGPGGNSVIPGFVIIDDHPDEAVPGRL